MTRTKKVKDRDSLANKKEAEINAWFEEQEELARIAFYNATRAAWDAYEAIWKPAREKWEAFSRPYFVEFTTKQGKLQTERSNRIGKVRANWDQCPICGTSYDRFQVWCSNLKCNTNLITARRSQGVRDASM